MAETKRYIVKTRWGTFSLDEASYEDYLNGDLWISWSPGKKEKSAFRENPVYLSEEAKELRDKAGADAYRVMKRRFPESLKYPYSERFSDINIDEMCLSVRSSNALKRAGILNFSQLEKRITQEGGLLSIRNLGKLSEAEVKQMYFEYCYHLLGNDEKGLFWQKLLETEKAGNSFYNSDIN